VILTINCDYFLKQLQPVGLCNGNAACFSEVTSESSFIYVYVGDIYASSLTVNAELVPKLHATLHASHAALQMSISKFRYNVAKDPAEPHSSVHNPTTSTSLQPAFARRTNGQCQSRNILFLPVKWTIPLHYHLCFPFFLSSSRFNEIIFQISQFIINQEIKIPGPLSQTTNYFLSNKARLFLPWK
jgi:hypothetical protein